MTATDMADNEAFKCRQAIEALRNGVPNQAAVSILGCNRPEAETRFNTLLAQCANPAGKTGTNSGMLVSGDFGSGKSHLLAYLENRALDAGFACSRVAISKETPLYNLNSVFISAVRHARLPDRTGQLMETLGERINGQQQLTDWANAADNGLHRYFPATLMIHARSHDTELRNEIEGFWSGENIKAARIREGLKVITQQQSFPDLKAPKAAELPPQRLRFAIELIKNAGYQGWVVMLDEIELVSSYSLLQRAKSYAELARWLGQTDDEQYPGLTSVGAVTRGYEAYVLGPFGRNDRETAANRLRENKLETTAARATAGIQALERDCIPLPAPSEEDLQETMNRLRRTYAKAYQWDAPDLEPDADHAAYRNAIRYRIRSAINEWDLRRIYPAVRPETEIRAFEHSYEEQPDMEQPAQNG